MFSNLRATHQQARKKLTCLARTEQLFTNDRGEWERNVLFSRSKLFLLNINYSCRRATGIVRNRKGSRENAFIRRNVLSEGGKEKKWAEQWEVVKEREQRKSLLQAVQYVYIYIYTNACDVQCFAIATPGHFLRQSQSHSCTVTYYA